jgi:vacuolar-type H+-ATPase subunit H
VKEIATKTIEDAKASAESMLAQAQNKARAMIEEHEITRQAHAYADQIKTQAHNEATHQLTDAKNKADELMKAAREQQEDIVTTAKKRADALTADAEKMVCRTAFLRGQLCGPCDDRSQRGLVLKFEQSTRSHAARQRFAQRRPLIFRRYSWNCKTTRGILFAPCCFATKGPNRGKKWLIFTVTRGILTHAVRD